MPVGNQQARLSATIGKPQAEYNVIQPGFQNLQQIQTRYSTAAQRRLIIAAELAFQHAIHAACFLFCAHLAVEIRFAFTAELRALTMLTDRKSTRLNSSHQLISYAVF